MRPSLRVLGFALICLIWGSTWLVIKVGYGGLGPFEVAAWRFLLAGLLLVPIGLAWGRRESTFRWPRGRVEWSLVAFVGIVLFGLDYGLIYWAELSLDSSLTAVLFAILPLMVPFVAHLYLPGERLAVRTLTGALVAFAGVALLFADRLQLDAGHVVPMLAIIASAACAAMSSVATKRHGHALHPIALNAPAMLIGGAALVIASFVRGDGMHLPDAPIVWWSILYLAIAGSIVTFLIFFWLLKAWSATSMGFVPAFTPLVALGLGALVGERLTPWMLAGTALVLAGVWLALRPKRPAAPAAEEAKPLDPARG